MIKEKANFNYDEILKESTYRKTCYLIIQNV